ncbi:DNA glycosylase [Dothidotthia symphoricarpi CBS 119687]|uniref:Adenine DNA glycosylase n=1 Tax=Dothidotthia symphoricarpi CBS 119687 TaxID=1392245 RepID=A0A6A6A814_9PLEO|nr:DNA glycosylase [Dothidotthia symphoricarpi CBS 119687]KAF2127696.1 DNA glycosylase [Dothidotthia symphoricarpi CBS 119687]
MPPRKKLPASAPKTSKSKPKANPKSSISEPAQPLSTASLPLRAHESAYHYALLLNDSTACDALLSWFGRVEETRSMPWRKKWIDPKSYEGKEKELGSILARRAYEVWVSEVMLQQTRVSTVIPYFNTWISKWPTVQDLAQANHDEVLSVWKGLGYYSRATRLHEGAQVVVGKSSSSVCPIPSSAIELQEFPGIGKYTAGAISSIAFGEAEPVLDGNVARVLSRQLGLYADVKDKKTSDLLWEVADQLIKCVSKYPEIKNSIIPGQWNQALMELGSTICTPRPKCDECPIQNTCRVYSEAQTLSDMAQPLTIPDIEDACNLCDAVDIEDIIAARGEDEDDDKPKSAKKRKIATKQPNNKISHYFAIGTPSAGSGDETKDEEAADDLRVDGTRKRKASAPTTQSKSISAYCSLYPKKVAKKKAAEEACVVCLVELRPSKGSSKWLIEQRPAKGLLASLWQFPQSTIPVPKDTPKDRKTSAQAFVADLDAGNIDLSKARYVASFEPLVHVFTHLKLTMNVHHYALKIDKADDVDLTISGTPPRKWVSTESMDHETLSTGMRKCWDLVVKSI